MACLTRQLTWSVATAVNCTRGGSCSNTAPSGASSCSQLMVGPTSLTWFVSFWVKYCDQCLSSCTECQCIQ